MVPNVRVVTIDSCCCCCATWSAFACCPHVRRAAHLGTTRVGPPSMQAKDALVHPYFDDLDKATIDLLESETVRLREGMPPY